MTVSIFLAVFCLGLVVSFFQSVLFYVFLFFIFAFFFMFLSACICVFMIAVVFILFISCVVFRSYFYCCLSCAFLFVCFNELDVWSRVYSPAQWVEYFISNICYSNKLYFLNFAVESIPELFLDEVVCFTSEDFNSCLVYFNFSSGR